MRALFRFAIVWAGLFLLVQGASASELPAVPVGTQQPATAQDDDFDCVSRITASPFIPVDSWVYMDWVMVTPCIWACGRGLALA
jgi:hypothetical protein